MPMIQIAGIRDTAEADMLMGSGVTDLGFPLGPGVRSPDTTVSAAASIVAHVGTRARCILITYLSCAQQILSLCERLQVGGVQIHGEISLAELSQLKRSPLGLFVIKSLVVNGQNLELLTAQVAECTPFVDAFLTDTFDPVTQARGATGKTHDWSVSRRLVELSTKPIVLAGGLTAANVAEAIRRVQPAGVDAHTGVERPDGSKDPEAVRRFVLEVMSEFKARFPAPVRAD